VKVSERGEELRRESDRTVRLEACRILMAEAEVEAADVVAEVAAGMDNRPVMNRCEGRADPFPLPLPPSLNTSGPTYSAASIALADQVRATIRCDGVEGGAEAKSSTTGRAGKGSDEGERATPSPNDFSDAFGSFMHVRGRGNSDGGGGGDGGGDDDGEGGGGGGGDDGALGENGRDPVFAGTVAGGWLFRYPPSARGVCRVV